VNPLQITDTNISTAWAKSFIDLMGPRGSQRHPAVVSIDDIEDQREIEIPAIRDRLDKELKDQGVSLCATVAGTLFPTSMWNPTLPNNAEALYARYGKAWAKIGRYPANRKGVYFRRLTAFSPFRFAGDPVNQLKFIVETYRGGNHRKSALQAAILDPTRDHTNNRQKGFPCLQQVSFTPLKNDRLSITGYYATQYHFEKAYGNYLGLYGLGRFMARQLDMQLAQVVCVASVVSLGNASKSQLQLLNDDMYRLTAT
jgi:hypothetical protein